MVGFSSSNVMIGVEELRINGPWVSFKLMLTVPSFMFG
jgi:hypothetical protein